VVRNRLGGAQDLLLRIATLAIAGLALRSVPSR